MKEITGPTWLYKDGEGRIVKSTEEALALGPGWTDSPYKAEPPPPEPAKPEPTVIPKTVVKRKRVTK